VKRDLRDVLRVMDLDAFDLFARLTAARTVQGLNLASLVALLQPHHANFS